MRSVRRSVTLFALLTIFVSGLGAPAHAQPQLQFPWSTASSFRINGGNTYGTSCPNGSHVNGGPSENPGNWDFYAIDFALSSDSDVHVVADGVIAKAQPSAVSGTGRYLVVDHGGYFTAYLHLATLLSGATEGSRWRVGQKIADSSNSGTEDPHLHFQMGTGTSKTSVTAMKPEPMTVLSGTTYVTVSNFGQWGGDQCHGVNKPSPFWKSAHPLTDQFAYASLGASVSDFGYANGAGGWTWDAVSPPTFAAGREFYPGTFADDGGTGLGDAMTDLYVQNRTTGEWWLYRTNSAGTLSLKNSGPGTSGRDVLTGDFNGDGLTDLYLWTKATGDWAVRLSDGAWDWDITSGTGTGNREVVTGSFNADMKTDLYLWTKTTGDWATRFADGAGDWTVPASGSGTANRDVVSGFFSSDRLTDLYLWTKTSGAWATRFADGSGDWTVPGDGSGTANREVVPGFFSSDKLTDLYLHTPTTGDWAVRFADGSGDWSVPGSGPGTANREVHAGFYDKDTLTDLFLYTTATGSWATRMSDGAGDWASIASGSFDSFHVMFPGYYDKT